MDEENYKQRYFAKFPTPTKFVIYDENILNNATNMAWSNSKDKFIHTAKIAVYQLIAAAKRETRDFILAAVDDKWVCKLCEPVTFYTVMAPSELLGHLQKLCGGLHDLNVLEL